MTSLLLLAGGCVAPGVDGVDLAEDKAESHRFEHEWSSLYPREGKRYLQLVLTSDGQPMSCAGVEVLHVGVWDNIVRRVHARDDGAARVLLEHDETYRLQLVAGPGFDGDMPSIELELPQSDAQEQTALELDRPIVETPSPSVKVTRGQHAGVMLVEWEISADVATNVLGCSVVTLKVPVAVPESSPCAHWDVHLWARGERYLMESVLPGGPAGETVVIIENVELTPGDFELDLSVKYVSNAGAQQDFRDMDPATYFSPVVAVGTASGQVIEVPRLDAENLCPAFEDRLRECAPDEWALSMLRQAGHTSLADRLAGVTAFRNGAERRVAGGDRDAAWGAVRALAGELLPEEAAMLPETTAPVVHCLDGTGIDGSIIRSSFEQSCGTVADHYARYMSRISYECAAE
ncbi:MAG: hypothetical protein JRH11_07860 [Deltaproteobacteria bacterium]|nr:hypothetical protein [Deltaproteobacteria bacterium]